MEFMYSFLSSGMDSRPAYGFSHRLRAAVEKHDVTPSPLDYFPGRISTGRSQGFSFGHRGRISFAKDSDTPGPGEYFIGKEIPVPRPRNSAWSFGLKPRQKRPKSHSPGPQYSVGNDWVHSGKGFSFGTANRPAAFKPRSYDQPGPGDYYADSSRKHFYNSNVKGYSFGLRVR